MTNGKSGVEKFSGLTWNDIEEWAGRKIAARGRAYQRRGVVSDLAVTGDGALVAWVNGTERYAAKVVMGEDGLPGSICTCPYGWECKHGVAVVLEALNSLQESRTPPTAEAGDYRLELLDDEMEDDGDWEDEPEEDEDGFAEAMAQEIDPFLKGKSKAQLIDLIHEIAGAYPEVARELSDRKQLTSGKTKTLVTRLRREIAEIGAEPGWQEHWNDDGFTPDYSGIRKRLAALLKAGYADEVLSLGGELVTIGNRQVEQSHDDGETATEVGGCMPVIIEALDQSSLDDVGKMEWALDAVLDDQYAVCEDFAGYLHRRWPRPAWKAFAELLLARLEGMKGGGGERDDVINIYARDELTDWAIHALGQAGRKDEIIPLCMVEAEQTGSYVRVVRELVEAQRYGDAETWIRKGIEALKGKWPGITADLRGRLMEIRKLENNWPVVAAMRVEEYVRTPSREGFTECREACEKAGLWPDVREALLRYLESALLPWEQAGWPLPESGLAPPHGDTHSHFPLVGKLIDVAILEKRPDQALRWYDQRSKVRFGRHGVDDDEVATVVQSHAPERAVDIWKEKAEELIGRVKPSAYHGAASYLRKAARVMWREKRSAEWENYLQQLRQRHHLKRRLLEILDDLDGKPIVKGMGQLSL